MRRVHGHIQHIIDNLEGQSGLAAEESEAGHIFQSCPGIDAAGNDADTDERAGLGAMNGHHQLRRGLLMFAFQVQHLAADHALDGADGVGDEADDLDGGRGR